MHLSRKRLDRVRKDKSNAQLIARKDKDYRCKFEKIGRTTSKSDFDFGVKNRKKTKKMSNNHLSNNKMVKVPVLDEIKFGCFNPNLSQSRRSRVSPKHWN